MPQLNNIQQKMQSDQPENTAVGKACYYWTIILLLIGFMVWIPNLVFHISASLWLLSVPVGVVALILSFKSYKRTFILAIFSILLINSFVLINGAGYIFYMLKDKIM